MKKKKYDHRLDTHNAVSSEESSIAFGFNNFDHGVAIFAGESPDYAYHGLGYGNPIVHEFEKQMAEGESEGNPEFDALATASGMSALDILTRYMCLGEDGKNEVIVSPKIYGGSHVYFSKLAPAMGIKCHIVKDPHDFNEWESCINKKTAFIFLETPGNPTADVFSLSAFMSLARSYNIPLVVDNTVATHALQRPIALGADISLVSASK